MPADVIDYHIIGDDLQAVVITLDPDEACVAEAGAMMFMQDDIEMATELSMKPGKGIFGKLFEAGKRAITGESFFITFFANTGRERRDVAFASPFPGRIVPLRLADHGGDIICQKDAFLCGARGIEVNLHFNKKLGTGFFGGEGFILQRISAEPGDTDALAFLHAGGSITKHELQPGEVLRVDTGCLVAFDPSVKYDIQMVPGLKNKFFGGEGLFYVKMTGPGTVWLQTLPFSRLANRILAAAPASGGSQKGEGSVLGSAFRMIDGS